MAKKKSKLEKTLKEKYVCVHFTYIGTFLSVAQQDGDYTHTHTHGHESLVSETALRILCILWKSERQTRT